MREWPWLAGALFFTLLCTGRSMAPAFGGADVIQDDARQHVFWMLRFQDPEMFRDDLIADYFESVAPIGYRAVYRGLSGLVDPRVASKLVPPVLGLATAGFAFLLTRRLYAAPTAAFLATVLLSWYVWQYDDLASGSPRAFLLPTLTAQLWAIVSGRSVLAVALVVLGATLYPAAGAIGAAILGARIVAVSNGSAGPRFAAAPRAAWVTATVAASLVAVVLLPATLGNPRFGPTVLESQARSMAEFGPGGRNAFFVPDAYSYWIASYRSGLDLRVTDVLLPGIPILLELALLALTLPFTLVVCRAARLSLCREAMILIELLAVSFGLFFLAHLLLFHLYLPARYVQWTVPLVLAVSAGLGLSMLAEALARRFAPSRPTLFAGSAALLGAGVLAGYPAAYEGNFVRDPHPAVTAYLRQQPADTIVVGVPVDADSVPSLTGRAVLVSREYALAYHVGYYGEMRRRLDDTIDAYYAESPRRVADFAARHAVDVFLVRRAAFDRETFEASWALQFEPFISEIRERLRRSRRFALLDLADRCSVVDDGEVAVVPAACAERAR